MGGSDPRRLHHCLRHAPSRRGRAPPGTGGRDRFRIAGEAPGVSRGRGVRHLRHVRRLRRRVRARGSRAQTARNDDSARECRRRLRELGVAHDSVDDGDHVPAAAVPGGGNRERRREAPQQGDLAVPALHARDKRVRVADRLRRPAAFSGWKSGCRYLRTHAADGGETGAARLAGVHRRTVGRHRHGDRRDHRALHDGVQRPGDAGAAQVAPPATERAPRSHRAAARHQARRDRADPVARLPVLQAGRRGLRAGVDRA